MRYIEIVKRLETKENVGKLNLAQLLKKFFVEISALEVENIEITNKENYYIANVYSTFTDLENNINKNTTTIKFNDVTFFAKNLGYERYDGAWRKKLYHNLRSLHDKKLLDKEIIQYSNDLESKTYSKSK